MEFAESLQQRLYAFALATIRASRHHRRNWSL